MLDSFPEIYLNGSGETSAEAFGVKTSLSTDTSVSAALKALRTTVSSSIGVEDREDISNELADLAEAYREGWSSGSDDDDD
ncbi:protein DML1 [Colletotrichum tofieldiae]|nr:protein DML1 [Colletotrichum tofieldiae]